MVTPFYIFGVFVQIALVGFAIHILLKVHKFLKKRKKWGGDIEGMAWAKCVLDPDGPTRPIIDDVKKYRHQTPPAKDKYVSTQRDD